MDSTQTFKRPYITKTPTQVQDDSGYKSMIRTCQDNSICEHGAMSKSMCVTCTNTDNSKIPAFRRLKVISVETVKKNLFPGSPYSPEGKSSEDSSKNSKSTLSSFDKLVRKRLVNMTREFDQYSFGSTKLPYGLHLKCPNSPPVKFFYSPFKNNKLFQSPKASPQKPAVPDAKTSVAPNSERWGASLSLPQLCLDLLKKIADMDLALASLILSCLSDQDLYRVGCVSRVWKQIVLNDTKARKRRENYVTKRISCKENKAATFDMEILRTNMTENDRELLLDMTNRELFKESQPSKIPTPKSEHFIAVAKELRNNEVLLKCPRCRYPAKCMKGNKYLCTRALCYNLFCSKCLGLHTSQECPVRCQFDPKVIVGSKRSKRNLKRL